MVPYAQITHESSTYMHNPKMPDHHSGQYFTFYCESDMYDPTTISKSLSSTPATRTNT